MINITAPDNNYLSEALQNQNLFVPYTDSKKGIRFYILSQKVAPVQQSFYFVNNSLSADFRYLWFYCAYPPSGNRNLGVVDLKEGEIYNYPETQFTSASPYVDPQTAEVYWGMGRYIWKRGPNKDDEVKPVNSLPGDLVGNRKVSKMATHLTRSADGNNFFIDARVGIQQIFGTLSLQGDDFDHWHSFNRNHNHAQFSPTDSDTVLFAQENHSDPLTGLRYPIENRMWIMKKGEDPYPLLEEDERPEQGHVTHEWWDPDGRHAWCVWGDQTWKVNINSREVVEKIDFPYHCWHSHSSKDGDYIVCDSNKEFYRGCSSSVLFMDRNTGKVIKIVDNPEKADYTGSNYHIDPHPRFCGQDQFIIFTTTIRGQVELAVVPVQDL
ncbi:MAG: hypothetical protein ACOCQ1_04795 [Halanaerobiaceae bacterium]